MVLPLVKLGALALKSFSKPIANRLKKEAGVHPKFRNFIVGIAQANHRLTTNVQRRIYGHATDVEIRPLNEEKAVKAASELIGELFIFTVAGIALLFEWQRSSTKEARKEEVRKQEMEAIRQRDEDLSKEVELLKLKLVDIENLAKARGLSGVFHFRNAQPEAAAQTPEAA
ncbi:OPA3-like protein [Drosera capensis]